MKKIWKKLLAVTLALSMTMSMVSITSLAAGEEEGTADTVTLTYDANADGDSVTGVPAAQKVNRGETVTVSNYRGMSRMGYTPLGWSTTRGAEQPDVGETYTLTADTTLFAVWESTPEPEKPAAGVTWDENTGILTAIGDGTGTLTADMLIEAVGADYKDKVKTLVVDGYSIGAQLFMGSLVLESVQLSNVKEIGYAAFQQDTNLTEFVLNSSDDTKTVIGNGAFSSTAIRELTLSNAELKERSFQFGQELTKVTLNGCDVTGMYVFQNCDKLTEINLTGSSNVTGNEAFSGMANLSSFSMTGGMLKAARVLKWAPKLTSITLDGVHVEFFSEQQGDWYPLNGTDMGTDIGEEKLKVTIKNSTLTKECLNKTVADELYLENVIIPDDTWPFYGTNSNSSRGTKLKVTGGSIGSYGLQYVGFEEIELNNVSSVGADGLSCNSTTLKTLILNGTNIGDQTYPLDDWRNGVEADTLTIVAKSDDCYLGVNAFWGVKYSNVILQNVNNVGTYAFNQNTVLQRVKFDNTNGKKTSIGDANKSCYTFQGCTNLTTIEGIEHLSLVGGRAFEGCTSLSQDFITALAKSNVILGYSSIFKGNAAMEARMKGILGGRFNLDLVPEAEELKPAGWESNKTGENNSTEPDSNQITKEAKWNDPDKTVADVQLQFSHSDKPGMDFLFILDLSDSMARIGNADQDTDSRYFSMQSKMIDVASKIVEADKTDAEKQYNNQVAFVTFGGYYNGVRHLTSNGGFTNDPDVVNSFMGMEALNQNTDYLAAFTEAKKLVDGHDESRKLAVIFISDGRPTYQDQTSLNTSDLINGTISATAAIARGFEQKGVEVFGVMQSVPEAKNEAAWAEKAMNAICSDGLVFKATDTDEFSEAVNKAIGAAYGTYTIVDQVGNDFDLDEDTIVASEGTVYEVSEDGRTITWTIYGLPFKTYTLSFQEKLHADLIDKVGSYNYNTNLGNATVNGDANSVETPVLPRAVDPTYKVVHVYYTNGSEDGRSKVVTVAGEAGETVTAESIDKVTTYGDNSYTFTSAEPESLTLTQKENGTIILRYDRTVTTTPTYLVTYSWTGLPDEATQRVPDTRSYYAGTGVRVNTAYTEGTEVTVGETTYVFSGWDTEDFTMPARNVEIKGVWTAKPAEEDVGETDTPTTESPEPTESPDPTETPNPTESPDPTETPEPTETQEPDEGEDLGDNDTPLAENPDEGENLGDNDTPLADVPQTGDMLWLWMTLAAGSAVSLAWISAEEKKGKRVSK